MGERVETSEGRVAETEILYAKTSSQRCGYVKEMCGLKKMRRKTETGLCRAASYDERCTLLLRPYQSLVFLLSFFPVHLSWLDLCLFLPHYHVWQMAIIASFHFLPSSLVSCSQSYRQLKTTWDSFLGLECYKSEETWLKIEMARKDKETLT